MLFQSPSTPGKTWDVNYLIDRSFANCNRYNDGASATPVDGTGGSPSADFTISIETTSPLRGSETLKISKAAADCQGNGVSWDFPIELADNGAPQELELEYYTSSGYADGDLTVYVYAVDAAGLCYPAISTLYASTVPTRARFEYQNKFSATFSSNTNYRAIVHCASTSATAYDVYIGTKGSWRIGPPRKSEGAVKVYLGALTTTGSWSTNTTYTGIYWQDDGFLIGDVKISTSGAPTSAALTLTLPSGLQIDPNKTTLYSDTNCEVGTTTAYDSGTGQYGGPVAIATATTLYPLIAKVDGTYSVPQAITQAVPMTFANGDYVHVVYRVPILGWGGNMTLSSDGGTRNVIVQGTSGNNQTLGSTGVDADAVLGTPAEDTHAMRSGNVLIVKESGYYDCQAHNSFSANATGARSARWQRSTDGGSNWTDFAIDSQPGSAQGQTSLNPQKIIKLNVNDQLKVVLNQSSGGSLGTVSDGSQNFISVKKVQGPQTIAASEKIYAKYYVTSSTANAAFASGAYEIVDYDLKAYDSHNAVQTGASWKFIAPRTDLYTVKTHNIWANMTNLTDCTVNIYKGGAIDSRLQELNGQQWSLHGAVDVYLLQGEYIDIRLSQVDSGAAARNIETGVNYTSWICIKAG